MTNMTSADLASLLIAGIIGLSVVTVIIIVSDIITNRK